MVQKANKNIALIRKFKRNINKSIKIEASANANIFIILHYFSYYLKKQTANTKYEKKLIYRD
jgi:hypothetical protein